MQSVCILVCILERHRNACTSEKEMWQVSRINSRHPMPTTYNAKWPQHNARDAKTKGKSFPPVCCVLCVQQYQYRVRWLCSLLCVCWMDALQHDTRYNTRAITAYSHESPSYSFKLLSIQLQSAGTLCFIVRNRITQYFPFFFFFFSSVVQTKKHTQCLRIQRFCEHTISLF